MRKTWTRKTRWILPGWILFLLLVFLHPLLLEALGQEHPPNCLVCVHFSVEFGVLVYFFVAHFLVLIAYFLAVPSAKLTSRFFFGSSGRAPPAVF